MKRGSTSEYNIVISHQTFVGELSIVIGEFSDLRCLMNSPSIHVLIYVVNLSSASIKVRVTKCIITIITSGALAKFKKVIIGKK